MKRKNKIAALATVLLLCLFSGMFAGRPSYAAGAGGGNWLSNSPAKTARESSWLSNKGSMWLYDGAGLFDSKEARELAKELAGVREAKGVDVVIVTVKGTGSKTAEQFADDYLDDGGYGFGAENNAVLLLIDVDGREIYISTQGTTALKSFSDKRIDKMLDDIANALGDNDYVKSARSFIQSVSLYMNTDPDTKIKEPMTVSGVLFRLGISVVIGAVISVILWLVLRRGTPMVVGAGDYLVENTVTITGQEDTFINTVTTTRHIERSSSQGNTTTTHRSSSGQIHGGGGRSF